jgi:hypothetical protein
MKDTVLLDQEVLYGDSMPWEVSTAADITQWLEDDIPELLDDTLPYYPFPP